MRTTEGTTVIYRYESYASGQIAHSRTVKAIGHTVLAEMG